MRISVSVPVARDTRVGVSIQTLRPTNPTVWVGHRIGGFWLTTSTILHSPIQRDRWR